MTLPDVNQDPNWAAQLNAHINGVEAEAVAAQATANAAVPATRSILAGTGLTGGGTLSADRTLTVAYGTSGTTATVGNDSRVTGAAQKSANLSDLTGPTSTARTNLGLGGAAVLNVGTSAGTVAAGDDSRITTAVPTSRLITAGTGLTGGGDLSADRTLTVAYGSTGTTACVGNDARLSDTRTPTDNTVTSAKIVDGAIVDADINASAAIANTKLATNPLARTNHTGTQLASTISDFNTQVATTAFLATGGTITGDLDVNGHALGETIPRNNGLIAWAYDPALATNGAAVTNGTVYLIGIQVNRSLTATKIYWGLNTAGVTPTSAQNWVGLYNSAGTRLATVDVTAKATSATLQTDTISQAVTPGLYWIGMVFNAATPPQPFRAGGLDSSLLNVGLTASTARYATNGTAQTTLPSSITPSSNTNNSIAWWAGLG
jgi:hypothetical protein